MALTKFGGGVVQMSGSIAGDVFARNRSGNYVRARTKPVNPKSPRQIGARTLVMMIAEQWRESPMDATKRGAWETYANAINWLNKLGEVIILSGYNHYIRSNTARINVGLARVDDGPTTLSLPGADATITYVAHATPQTIDVSFDNEQDWRTEDNAALALDVGEPKPASRNYFGGPWRYAGKSLGSSGSPVSSPQSVASPWTLIVGQVIWCRSYIIRADGRVTNKFRTLRVVVEA